MAGEQSGNLADTINSYIEYEKVISRTKQSIKRALIYPALLLGLSFALMAVIINFIIPRFSNFYNEFGAQLPAITSALVSFSLFIKKRFYVGLILFAVLAIVLIQMGRKEKSQVWLDKLKMMIPYANKIWVEAAVALFSRTLWLLLKGGISLIPAVSIAHKAVPNKYLRKKMSNLAESIRHGESLSNSIDRAGFFDSLALDMIRIGESSANLDGMLKEVAEVYDDRIQGKIDTFVSLFEPLIIIFMGLIVALMLLSVYIPIFNLIRVVR
jgi:type IV pilus assembly protein PilC